MSGFDLFNHMADVVTARGKEAAADAFDLLAQDLEQNIKGEPAVKGNKGNCANCRYPGCRYNGLQADELPAWMKK